MAAVSAASVTLAALHGHWLPAVFDEVARGHVDYGLVPVENTILGSVAETLDCFAEYGSRVAICAEVQVRSAQFHIRRTP